MAVCQELLGIEPGGFGFLRRRTWRPRCAGLGQGEFLFKARNSCFRCSSTRLPRDLSQSSNTAS